MDRALPHLRRAVSVSGHPRRRCGQARQADALPAVRTVAVLPGRAGARGLNRAATLGDRAMLDPASTTSAPTGFPVELRPLLVLVIVLAILHMVLRMRVRKGPPARRTAQRRAVPPTAVEQPREATPMKERLPPDPAAALDALRRQAADESQRA